MSDLIANLRPGVTSRVEVTGCPQAGHFGEAALALYAPAPFLEEIAHFAPAPDSLAPETKECLGLLFAGGVSRVHLAGGPTLAAALALVESAAVGAVVCDCRTPDDFGALKAFLTARAEGMAECLGFVGAGDPEAALAAAKALCHERGVVCCPGAATLGEGAVSALYAPCALAARVLAAAPGHSFSGEEFPGLTGVARLPEARVQQLLAAGVCVFEELGGGVELIRGLTTATTQNGAESNCMGGLNTVLLGDEVVRRIRQMLQSRLRGAAVSLGSIRDQVAVELAALVQEGILAGFDPPRVRRAGDDPTACLVDVAFGVAHLIERIHLTAHIRV